MDVVLASGDASGNGNGALYVGDITTIASIVGNTLIGNIDPSQIESLINPAAIQAEAGQPEGAPIELDITGWTNPVTGTDYSQAIADQINSYWSQGEFIVDGEVMQAWSGNSQVAWGSQDLGIADTLIVQYVKGQPWLILILAAVAVIAAAAYIFQYENNSAWKLGTSCQAGDYWNGASCVANTGTGTQTCNSGYHWTGAACEKNPNWFQQLPESEQLMIMFGGGAVLLLGVVFALQYSLAKAGASNISIGGQP
jgi:hypothetical protein